MGPYLSGGVIGSNEGSSLVAGLPAFAPSIRVGVITTSGKALVIRPLAFLNSRETFRTVVTCDARQR